MISSKNTKNTIRKRYLKMVQLLSLPSSRSSLSRHLITTWWTLMSDMSASLDLKCSSILNLYTKIGLNHLVALLMMPSRAVQLNTESSFTRTLFYQVVAPYLKALIKDSKTKYRTFLMKEWPFTMLNQETMIQWKQFAHRTWCKGMLYGLEEVFLDQMMPLEDTKHARCTKSMDLKFVVTTQSSRPLSYESNLQ